MQANAFLRPMAEKYIWWKTPEQALDNPHKIIAQVMNIGEYTDAQALINKIGANTLINVLKQAQVGEFSPKSWAYWHYRLGLSRLEDLPKMPVREMIS